MVSLMNWRESYNSKIFLDSVKAGEQLLMKQMTLWQMYIMERYGKNSNHIKEKIS